jgi:hypothetical protein
MNTVYFVPITRFVVNGADNVITRFGPAPTRQLEASYVPNPHSNNPPAGREMPAAAGKVTVNVDAAVHVAPGVNMNVNGLVFPALTTLGVTSVKSDTGYYALKPVREPTVGPVIALLKII